MTAELGYFVRHARERKRMEYATLAQAGLPLGSGAIESAVRRVINLRLKGNSMYWTEENAEAVFQLRAAVVSGRWDEIHEHTQAGPDWLRFVAVPPAESQLVILLVALIRRVGRHVVVTRR